MAVPISPILRRLGVTLAGWTAIDYIGSRAMGEKISLPKAMARSIPWVIGSEIVPWLMPAVFLAMPATVGANLWWETGKINRQYQKQFSMVAYGNDLYVDTDRAHTLRQQAVATMQGTQQALRSVIGNEGKIMHDRLNVY